MPITASINRHPEAESQSETAAPHPEEMKATFDLAAIGNAVSVKAAVRTTPAGLAEAAILAAAIVLPTISLDLAFAIRLRSIGRKREIRRPSPRPRSKRLCRPDSGWYLSRRYEAHSGGPAHAR